MHAFVCVGAPCAVCVCVRVFEWVSERVSECVCACLKRPQEEKGDIYHLGARAGHNWTGLASAYTRRHTHTQHRSILVESWPPHIWIYLSEKRARGRKQLWGQEAKCRVFRPPVSLSCACHHMRTILDWAPLRRELQDEKKVVQKNKYGCLLTAQPSKHPQSSIFSPSRRNNQPHTIFYPQSLT